MHTALIWVSYLSVVMTVDVHGHMYMVVGTAMSNQRRPRLLIMDVYRKMDMTVNHRGCMSRGQFCGQVHGQVRGNSRSFNPNPNVSVFPDPTYPTLMDDRSTIGGGRWLNSRSQGVGEGYYVGGSEASTVSRLRASGCGTGMPG